ncbi:zinc finger protein 585A-like [Spea bombifrons]|uniref:zinc finger protein 585A-like n=1 Tax=Spea bombifrons TaxID=233779 RepID=UPI00234995B3|nr:zinc finger protein 585A-like [Spea bombifrons]
MANGISPITVKNECYTESLPDDWDTESTASISIHNERETGKGRNICENKENQLADTEESRPDRVSNNEYIAEFWERPDEMDKKTVSGEKRYHCIDCGKSFTRKSSLIVHQRIHTGEKRFMCIECGKKFGLKSSLVRHLRTHTPKALNICPECGKCFTRYSSLFQHQKVHRTEKLYKCSHCEKSFSRASALVVHQKTHKEEKLSNKTESGEKINDHDKLVNHLSATEESCVYVKCYKDVIEQGSPKRLRGKHTVADPVPKDNADKVFCIHNSSLGRERDRNTCKPSNNKNNHEKTCWEKGDCARGREQSHTNKKCEFSSIESRTLCGEKRYHCIDCGKSFTRKSSLIVHQRIHTGEKRFICTECGKRFGLKSSLVRHLRTHTPKTLNICPDCGKCFARYSNLFQHQKVHRREKPSKCSQREKRISRPLQLLVPHNGEKHPEKVESGENIGAKCLANNQNVRMEHDLMEEETYSSIPKEVNTGVCCINPLRKDEKPAAEKSCLEVASSNECTERFWGRSEVLGRRTVSSEKRYLCIDCGKSFTRKSSLIVHQRIHTGEKRFMCTECGKRFGLKSSLVRHLRTHTPKTLNICPECGKCFARYSSLFQHQKVHRREKPHKCHHCEKSFSRTSQLLVHQRTHKGGKLSSKLKCESVGEHPRTNRTEQFFMCVECGMSFCEEILLTTHQKIHKGECCYNYLQSGVEELETFWWTLEWHWNRYFTRWMFLTGYRERHGKWFSFHLKNLFVLRYVQPGISPACKYCTSDILTVNYYMCLFSTRALGADCIVPTSLKDGASDVLEWDSVHDKSYLVENNYTTHNSSPVNINPDSRSRGPNTNSECVIDVKHESSTKAHGSEKRYHCNDCGKNFTRKSSLIVHERIHTGEKRFTCTECGKRFGLKSSLVRHIRTHSGRVLNICSKCGIYFSRYSDLLLHLEIHNCETQVKSDVSVSKAEPVESHSVMNLDGSVNVANLLASVPVQKDSESCLLSKDQSSECEKSRPVASECMNDSVLIGYSDRGEKIGQDNQDQDSVNIKKESPENICTADGHLDGDKIDEFPSYPYALDWGVEFDISKPFNGEEHSGKQQTSRRRKENCSEEPHLDVMFHQDFGINVWNTSNAVEKESGEKRFLCIDCGKSFTRKSSLIVHQRIHTGEKHFMCTECGKRFGLKSSLVRHQRIHSTEFFRCIECGKSFREYSKFLHHQASHTGEWPYKKNNLTVR